MNGLSSPNSKRGRLHRACLNILEAHRDNKALPTSARFIFYELVQAGIVSKHKTGARRPDQNVSDALAHLRNVEIVPWQWIVDETRSLSAWRYAATVADFVFETVPQARLDLWDGDMPPIIVAESRSLAGVLRDLAALYLVPITATNGQVGGHLHTEIAPSLGWDQRVLYLGDFDWQGGQIENNTRNVL